MQRLLGKVEEMKTQRETLEQQLREQIRNDDVTGDIVTKTRGSMQVRHTITHCTTPSKPVVYKPLGAETVQRIVPLHSHAVTYHFTADS